MMTVYPADLVDRQVARDIARIHPDVLVIRHPAFGTYQLYENPTARRGAAQWDAFRLYNAVAAFNAKGREGPQWWKWPGAPHLIETLPHPPGTWLVQYLARKDFGRYPGGAKQWFKDLEAEEERRKADSRKRVSDIHHDVAYESGFHRHARDVIAQDPLAGQRKWVHSVQTDLK